MGCPLALRASGCAVPAHVPAFGLKLTLCPWSISTRNAPSTSIPISPLMAPTSGALKTESLAHTVALLKHSVPMHSEPTVRFPSTCAPSSVAERIVRFAPESRSRRMDAPPREPVTTGMPWPSARTAIVAARCPHTDPAVPSSRHFEPHDEVMSAAANAAPVSASRHMHGPWYQRASASEHGYFA